MRRKFGSPWGLSIILAIVALVSCRGNGNERKGNEGTNVTQETATASADTVYVEEVAPEPPKPDLSTTESQIEFMKNSGNWDKYETGILPQMAVDVPKYCEQLLDTARRFIIVDKGKMKLFLYDPYGNIEKQYGIACAQNYGTRHRSWTSRTTEGFFHALKVENSTDWLFQREDGTYSPVKGQYGPRFIRLDTPAIGIHGTSSPSSIGKRCSHGCIRVTNANILELVEYVEPGMPVIISPGPRDMAVNKQENYYVPSVSTEPGSPRAEPGYPPAPKPAAAQETEHETNEEVDNSGETAVDAPTESESGETVSEPAEVIEPSKEPEKATEADE